MNSVAVVNVSVDEIIEPTTDMRSFITKETLDELADSIRRVGVLQPLLVVKQGPKYEIVAGHRRFLASRQAGLLVVPCIVQDLTAEQMDIAKAHENLFREDVAPVDEANYYALLINKYHYDLSRVAGMVSRTIPYVQGRLDILSWDPYLLEALNSKMLSLSVARELSKITDKERRDYFIGLAVQNGITAETARQWRYQFEIERGVRPPLSTDPAQASGVVDQVPLNVTCQGCLRSVDITKSRVLYLCAECHKLVTQLIEGAGVSKE